MKNTQLQAILLPTKDSSHLYIQHDKLCYDTTIVGGIKDCNDQHLYLCSTLPIKQGDWVYHKELKTISKIESFIEENTYSKYYKTSVSNRYAGVKLDKIEFTTDPKLIANGIFAIDGNTKAKIKIAEHIDNKESNLTTYYDKEVNFLKEYCKRYNQKCKSLREIAMKWWSNLSFNLKSELSNKHFKKTVAYNFGSLTGREIESIYQKDNNIPICWNCGSEKKVLTGLCSNCGRFHVEPKGVGVKKLHEDFEKESGIKTTNSQGEPDIDYVDWLEKKYLQSNAGEFSLEDVGK